MKHIPHLYQGLKSYTLNENIISELMGYLEPKFEPSIVGPTLFEFEDEPQITAWQRYQEEAEQDGVFNTLSKYLVQLQFPIAKNISQSQAYRNVTLKGRNAKKYELASGLQLLNPNHLELFIYDSIAGKIPVIQTSNQADFESLVRAFSCRNEPIPLPSSMGAALIKGLNNWDRLRSLQKNWQGKLGNEYSSFKEYLHKYKSLYQDNLIVLSQKTYSNVPADELNLDPYKWIVDSSKLRLAHECTHYFTLRYFGKMSNHIHDELIADYVGIKAISPSYKADWFLLFMGLENYPHTRENGRFFNYLGQPSLSKDASKVLQEILIRATQNLSIFDFLISNRENSFCLQSSVLSICHFNLIDIASSEGLEKMIAYYNYIRKERQPNARSSNQPKPQASKSY